MLGHLSKASIDLPEGKRWETMAGRNAVWNTSGASHLEKVWCEVGEHFSVVASGRHPRCVMLCRSCAFAGRAVEAHQHPMLSSAVIQCSEFRWSVLTEWVCYIINCASLYAFCNEFQVKMYYNYCIIFRTTRFEAGPPNSQGWWFGGTLPQNVNFEPCSGLYACLVHQNFVNT